jgi:SpoVK/Ycf46/Vps4 family AAA+-type ATPase
MSHWFEVLKIIDAALKLDSTRVVGYSKLLSEKLDQEGQSKISNKIDKLLTSKSIGVIKNAELNTQRLPYDQESNSQLGETIFPSEIDEEVVLNEGTEDSLKKFIEYYNNREKLLAADIEPLNKILLYGPPGCGKTLLAKNVAKRLNMPIIVARLDSLISSFLGNTSKNVRNFFEYAQNNPCILFIDEFDAVAKLRDDKHELGELKRVVNSLLQNIDSMDNGSILITATNHEQLLDPAIWRRFSMKIKMGKPEYIVRYKLIKKRFAYFSEAHINLLCRLFENMSGAAISEICTNCIRESIINDKEVSIKDLTEFYFSSHFYTDENHLLSEDMSNEQKAIYLRNIDSKVFSYSIITELIGIPKSTLSRLFKKNEGVV